MCLVCAGCKVLSTIRAYCTGFMPNITVIIAPKSALSSPTCSTASSTSDIAVHRSIPEIYVPNDKYNEETPIRRKSHGSRKFHQLTHDSMCNPDEQLVYHKYSCTNHKNIIVCHSFTDSLGFSGSGHLQCIFYHRSAASSKKLHRKIGREGYLVAWRNAIEINNVFFYLVLSLMYKLEEFVGLRKKIRLFRL